MVTIKIIIAQIHIKINDKKMEKEMSQNFYINIEKKTYYIYNTIEQRKSRKE